MHAVRDREICIGMGRRESFSHDNVLVCSTDGLKDKDKRVLMQVLKQVSSYKDNEYNLLRGIWNDVQEDWPHYSPHEREIMKRCDNYSLCSESCIYITCRYYIPSFPPGANCAQNACHVKCNLISNNRDDRFTSFSLN